MTSSTEIPLVVISLGCGMFHSIIGSLSRIIALLYDKSNTKPAISGLPRRFAARNDTSWAMMNSTAAALA
jgi:hypothetical protein